MKLQVRGNIQVIFTKFIDTGKATISFIEPPHNLYLTSDAIQLKSFLLVLKQSLDKNANLSVLSISNLKPKKLTEALRTKIVVKSVKNYPTLEGFPRTTEKLYITNLERKNFDRQILKLQNLRVLDLSENRITSLPSELGALPNLQELNVAGNNLGQNQGAKSWSWLNHKKVAENLKLLNLSSNNVR